MKPKLTFLLSLIFLFLLSSSSIVLADEYDFERRQRNARGIWQCKLTYLLYNENGEHLSDKTVYKVGDKYFFKISEDTISFMDKGEWVNTHKIEWDLMNLTASSKDMVLNFDIKTGVLARAYVRNFITTVVVSSLSACKRPWTERKK